MRTERIVFRQPPTYPKKEKKENVNLIKTTAAYPQNKKTKKTKNHPKTQTVFTNQNSLTQTSDSSLHLHIHTDRTCKFQPIKQMKNKTSTTVKTSIRSLQ